MLAFIYFSCLKSSLGFLPASAGGGMPFSSTMNSDLHSAAMPRELGHFHAVSRQNCTEVTVLAHTSVILSAGTTHTSCSGRGQKPHYVTLYAQGMKSLFLYCKEGLFTSPENGTCLSHPWCVQLQTLPWVIKSHIFSYSAHLSKKKKKRHQISANRHSHVCMVAAIR